MTSPTDPQARRRSNAVWCALLILITAAVYAPVIHFQFLRWDDPDLLLQNKLVLLPSVGHLKTLWTAPYAGLYSPLSYTFWWLIQRFSLTAMPSPAIFHAANLFLHLAATVVVYSILKKCVNSPSATFAGAAVFALHPLQVESVAWVSQTNNLLAASLSFVAIRLYLEYAGAAPPRRAFYFAASAAFLLAMFAKPTAVIVPALAAILDYHFLRRSPRQITRSLFPWLCAAIVFAFLAHHFQPAPGVHAGALLERPAIAADSVAFYLSKIFWPARLTIDYARTPATVLSGHRWIVGVIAAIVLLSLGKTLGRLRIGLLIMVAALLPVLGFLPFDFQRYSTVADRFMYLPMLGVALAAAACPRPFVFLILILLAWQAEFQLGFWRDTRTLADRTLALDPLSTVGNKILAADLAHDQQWPRAAAAYRKALIHNPEDGDLHFNLANALRGQGDYESAIDEYLTSIRLLNPDLRLGAMNNLGIAYFQAGEPDMAQAEFLAVLQIDPHNADARKNLAQVVRGVPSQ